MCGWFVVIIDLVQLVEKIMVIDEVIGCGGGKMSYNVVFIDMIVIVVFCYSEFDDEFICWVWFMCWGLILLWIKVGFGGVFDVKGLLLINVCVDKVVMLLVFWSVVRSKCCLVLMDGWYEWCVDFDVILGRLNVKMLFFLYCYDGVLLFMVGLWLVWKFYRFVLLLLSCMVIIIDVVGELVEIYDWMLLLLVEEDWDDWLNLDVLLDFELLVCLLDVCDIVLC